MLERKKLDRINDLAHKKKVTGLTREEEEEQHELRQEYLKTFRKSFRGQLDQIEWTD